MITVDVNQFRELIPSYREHPQLTYLDNATAKLIPDPVIEAFNEPIKAGYLIARKGSHLRSIKATEIWEKAREEIGHWHGQPPSHVIFQPTLPLANLLVAEALQWMATSRDHDNHQAKKQIFLLFSPDTHNSTFLPWFLAAKRWKWKWKVLPPSFLNSKVGAETLASVLEESDDQATLPILILSDVSMVLGWTPPLADFQRVIKKHEGKMILDISRAYQFYDPKLRWRDVDYLVASLGIALWMPHGLAVAIGKEEWPAFPPSFTGSGMVQQVTLTDFTVEKPPLGLEPDTLSLPHANALITCLHLLKRISPHKIRQHDEKLRNIAQNEFLELPHHLQNSCHLLSKAWGIDTHVQGILSFSHDSIDPVDIAIFLEELYQVIIRPGDQCTQLLFRVLPSNENMERGVIQASFSYYNTEEDVVKLIRGLEDASTTFSVQ